MSEASTAARAIRLLPALLYTGGIFYGGVIDIGKLPETPGISPDKLLHSLVFLVFETLLELGFADLPARARRWFAVGVASGIGGLLELVQAALPHRSAELWDFIADTAGALLGAAFVALAVRHRAGAARRASEGRS